MACATLAGIVLGMAGVPMLLLQLLSWGLMLDRYLEIMPLRDALAFTMRHTSSCGYDTFTEEDRSALDGSPDLLAWKDIHLLKQVLPAGTLFRLRPGQKMVPPDPLPLPGGSSLPEDPPPKGIA